VNTKEKKVFFLYTLAIAILILIAFSLNYIYKEKEKYYLVVRLYNFIEYGLLSFFFYLHIKKRIIKNILLFSIIPFLIFCINNLIVSDKPELPFLPLAVEYVVLLIFITYFFFEVMKDTKSEPIYHKAVFWISSAFILNFSGNFFLFLYSKNSYDYEIFQRHYTIIYGTITILKNILLCVSIYIKEESEKKDPSIHFDSFDSFKSTNY